MKHGFTLIELLISITIIGILASVGLSTFTTAQIKARDAKRKSNLDQISRALEMYFNDHKEYPDTDLIVWNGIFQDANNTIYMVKVPQDPAVGQTYYYESFDSGKKFQLYAYLENSQDPSIITINSPDCGIDKICNYGISSTNTTPQSGR